MHLLLTIMAYLLSDNRFAVFTQSEKFDSFEKGVP